MKESQYKEIKQKKEQKKQEKRKKLFYSLADRRTEGGDPVSRSASGDERGENIASLRSTSKK